MDLKKLEHINRKPPLYEKGDSVMWTDEHISKKLLELHLDPEVDLASRSGQNIDSTVEFISGFCGRPGLDILDLGCGPGIYATKLAGMGHRVTGVDFSATSIEYASRQANARGLAIDYVCRDYLDIDYEDMFDMVLLIYTDLGVLVPADREKLLANVHRALKPGGLFIFDVINDKNTGQKFRDNRSWTLEDGGFWRNSPYLELTGGFHYPRERVFLQQHVIIDQAEHIKTYRFWTHYFARDDVVEILANSGFSDTENFENVLPGSGLWSGESITFYKTVKPG